MLEDKINKYYNQLLEYSYKYCHDRYVIDYEHGVKYVLKELIENNNERYLTNSFLDFIACESYYIWHFNFILKEDEPIWSYRIFNAYFDSIISDINSMKKHQQNDYHLFTKELDEKILNSVIYYKAQYEKRIEKLKWFNYMDYRILYMFFSSLLSYCLMNNIMDDYINLCKKFLNERNSILDYFHFKRPCDEVAFISPCNEFYNIFKDYIENNNDKVII